MFTQTFPVKSIIVEKGLPKQDFFLKYGSLDDYHEICEKCPIIDRIYKSADPQICLGYLCSDCGKIRKNSLLKLFYGAFLTYEYFYLSKDPFFKGDFHFILSPIDVNDGNFVFQDELYNDIFFVKFYLWKLVYSISSIEKAHESELKFGKSIWTEENFKKDSQKQYTVIKAFNIFIDPKNEFYSQLISNMKQDLICENEKVFCFKKEQILFSLDDCLKEVFDSILEVCETNKNLIFVES